MKKNGFTLMEVMIATAIMVAVLGALVYGLTQGTKLTETSRNQDIALNAARLKLEEIDDSGDPNSFNGQTFPVEDAQGNPLLTAPSGQGDPGQVAVAAASGTTDNKLFDVTVTVTWEQSAGRQLSRTLTATFVE